MNRIGGWACLITSVSISVSSVAGCELRRHVVWYFGFVFQFVAISN